MISSAGDDAAVLAVPKVLLDAAGGIVGVRAIGVRGGAVLPLVNAAPCASSRKPSPADAADPTDTAGAIVELAAGCTQSVTCSIQRW